MALAAREYHRLMTLASNSTLKVKAGCVIRLQIPPYILPAMERRTESEQPLAAYEEFQTRGERKCGQFTNSLHKQLWLQVVNLFYFFPVVCCAAVLLT